MTQRLYSTKPALKKATQRVVQGAFADALHHKHVLSLVMITIGVLLSDRLGIAAVGLAMSRAFGKTAKHGKKQVDRYLSNQKMSLNALFLCLVPFVVGKRQEIYVTMDWTEFDHDDQSTLALALLTPNKRTQPLLWMTVKKSTRKGKMRTYERRLLQQLRDDVPDHVVVVIVADRGFADVKLYKYMRDTLRFHFVVRYRQNTYVEYKGWLHLSSELVPRNGRRRVIPNTTVTAKQFGPLNIVLYKAAKMKQPWCLATSLSVTDGAEIVRIYGARFRCEETFRDLKDVRYGYGLRLTAIRNSQRRDRFIFVFALAYLIHTLMGLTSEHLRLDKGLRANTVNYRTHSLFQQGRALLASFSKDLRDAIVATFTALLRLCLAKGVVDAFS
jgi:hypothetical protein